MTHPDPRAPEEEAEGVWEVLEVRKGAWELGREEAESPAEPRLPAPQFDYEYTEAGERLVLGKGTYGVVYAGRDRHTRVRIAIKEIPERDSRCARGVSPGGTRNWGGRVGGAGRGRWGPIGRAQVGGPLDQRVGAPGAQARSQKGGDRPKPVWLGG